MVPSAWILEAGTTGLDIRLHHVLAELTASPVQGRIIATRTQGYREGQRL